MAWRVLYLQAEGAFERLLPELHAKLRRAVADVDAAQGWGLLARLPPDEWAVRCAEYHQMGPSRGLSDPGHYDTGSLITVDVMLSRPGVDHEGGELCTRKADGTDLEHRAFGQGDALVFISHKPHFVRPVVRGVRQVFVVEFWRGEARVCPHRCQLPLPGACALKVQRARERNESEFEDAFLSLIDSQLLEAAMAALKHKNSDEQA
jgi:hypothetical protein